MRQLLIFLTIFSSILSCSSCRKEPLVGPSATVQISIKTVFGDEPFIIGKEYDYPSQGSMRVDDLAVFLSDISLVTANSTDEVALDDIAYLDIASIQYDMNTANQGWSQSYFSVPLGDYTGIKFGLGVTQEENSQDPKQFSSGSPLGVLERYSSQFHSYVFEDIGGKYYVGDDTTDFRIRIVEDQMYKQVSLSKSFSVKESGNEIEIIFDLKKVFQSTDSIMNLADYPVVVSPSLPQMEWLAKNSAHSFSF